MSIFLKVHKVVFPSETAPRLPHSVGALGATHRWVPDLQPERPGEAVSGLSDIIGDMHLPAMAAGARTMSQTAQDRYVSNTEGIDQGGFLGQGVLPAGPKTVSLVVRAVGRPAYLAQAGGFHIYLHGGNIWALHRSGTDERVFAWNDNGRWGNILLRWDGSTGYLWLNGVRRTPTSITGEGALSPVRLIHGPGRVDLREAITWDRALSDAEITAHYQAMRSRWKELP